MDEFKRSFFSLFHWWEKRSLFYQEVISTGIIACISLLIFGIAGNYFVGLLQGRTERIFILTIFGVVVTKPIYWLIMEIIRDRNQIKLSALRDPLTGLYNRSFLDDAIHMSLAKAQRHAEEFCVFVIDVDNLKYINDNYGHNAGNDAIIAITSVIEMTAYRREDFILRVGGDEIAIICSTKNPQQMHARLSQNLFEEYIQFYINGKRVPLSASVGYSRSQIDVKFYERQEEKDLYEKLFAEADVNMYEQKRGQEKQ